MRRRTPPLNLWLPVFLLFLIVSFVYKIKQIITHMPLSAYLTLVGFVLFSFLVLYFLKFQTGETKHQIYQRKVEQLRDHTQKEDLYRMNYWEFQHFVANFFEITRGYKTFVGKKGPDGGKDITMIDEGERIYVEVKHWKSSVGRPLIQKLFGVMSADGIKRGYFVTSSYFTRQAHDEANKTGVILIDGDSLVRQINEFDIEKETLAKESEVLT